MAILLPLCHKVAALSQIIREWRMKQITLTFLVVRLLLLVGIGITAASAQPHRVAEQLAGFADHIDTMPVQVLLADMPQTDVRQEAVHHVVGLARFSSLQVEQHKRWRTDKPAFVRMSLIFPDGEARVLRMQQVSFLAPDFQIHPGSDPRQALAWDAGLFYWGVVEGAEASLSAIAVLQDEVMGFVQIGEAHYTLGRLDNREKDRHILYATDDVLVQPPHACQVDEALHTVGGESPTEGNGRSGGNCFRLMVEVDHDIVVGKGGVQQAVDYILGVFSQVAILYANEDIQLHLSQMVVWDVADPYTGPSSGQYLSQFGALKNGQFNGDLAHLVGYGGTGGVAYLDVLCNPQFALGYSTIYASYQQVPVYSWSVMVLAHEIGHNLGSRHTHACAWNGNNTAIDGCGPQAGYSEGCAGPIPASGTVMSYCYLLAGVGINFQNGFGPQPGDRIRQRLADATCLEGCGPVALYDVAVTAIGGIDTLPCSAEIAPVITLFNGGLAPLTAVLVEYGMQPDIGATYTWTGHLPAGQALPVVLPPLVVAEGPQVFQARASLPQGQQDEVPSNDQSTFELQYIPGHCECYGALTHFSPNPLTKAGPGAASTVLQLQPGSKHVDFLLFGLDFKLTGAPSGRYNDRVQVSWVDGQGQSHQYGTWLGTESSNVPLHIAGYVQSVTITLDNELANGYTGTLSVSMSVVSYCGPENQPACPDEDGDGVCDEVDRCPGMDDALLGMPCNDGDSCTEEDMVTLDCQCTGVPVPDCQPEEPCLSVSRSITPNPLMHSGEGTSMAALDFPAGTQSVALIISGLDARITGNPNQRFIDKVTVRYQDGQGQMHTYGVFTGQEYSTVEVFISGPVSRLEILLANDIHENPQPVMVFLSSVTSCEPVQPVWAAPPGASRVEVFPNPAGKELFVRLPSGDGVTRLTLYNALGVALASNAAQESALWHLPLDHLAPGAGLLFLVVERLDGERQVISVARVPE